MITNWVSSKILTTFSLCVFATNSVITLAVNNGEKSPLKCNTTVKEVSVLQKVLDKYNNIRANNPYEEKVFSIKGNMLDLVDGILKEGEPPNTLHSRIRRSPRRGRTRKSKKRRQIFQGEYGEDRDYGFGPESYDYDGGFSDYAGGYKVGGNMGGWAVGGPRPSKFGNYGGGGGMMGPGGFGIIQSKKKRTKY